jgi:hypothetical protein
MSKLKEQKTQPTQANGTHSNGAPTNGKVPSRFAAFLKTFLADWRRRDKEAPPDFQAVESQWRQLRDDVIKPVLDHTAAELSADGRPSTVTVDGEGKLVWSLTVGDRKIVIEVSSRLLDGKQLNACWSQRGKPGERFMPAAGVTPVGVANLVTGVLIQVVYS